MGAVWRDTGGNTPRKLKLNVPQTLVGEEAKVTVSNPNRKKARALPDEIVKASPERIEPACPHFELCGGCVWQHWSYGNQLQYKTEEVKRFLSRHGFDTGVVKDAIGADSPWEYRNKMEFTFGRDGSLGMHELGNFRKVIDLDTCLIAGNEMVEAMLEVSEWQKEFNLSGYDKDAHTGLLRNLMGRITEKFDNVKGLMWMENREWADMAQSEKTHTLYGRDYINDEMYGYKYRIWFDTFFQTNPVQAEKLVDLAIDMADAKKDER